MPKAVIHTATGAVLRYGYCDFSAELSAGLSQVNVSDGAVPVAGIPLYHNKVAAGAFVAMTAPEKAAVDAMRTAESTAKLEGAIRVQRVVNSVGELPLPPPEPGLLVGVVAAGQVGLAISGADRWYLFAVDGVVGP